MDKIKKLEEEVKTRLIRYQESMINYIMDFRDDPNVTRNKEYGIRYGMIETTKSILKEIQGLNNTAS